VVEYVVKIAEEIIHADPTRPGFSHNEESIPFDKGAIAFSLLGTAFTILQRYEVVLESSAGVKEVVNCSLAAQSDIRMSDTAASCQWNLGR
jgi:hypothetical protein